MGKKGLILQGRSKEERAKQRQQLGSLRSLTVQPATKKRYDAALNKFFDFLKYENISLPTQKVQMDGLLSEYIEHLWRSGEGRALASDTVAGLQDLEPHLKGGLPTVWRLLKVWNQNELPCRAPPMPEPVLHAMVGRAIFKNETMFALSLLVGFYGMMRTGEILSLTSKQVEVSDLHSPAVIALGLTKSGKRQGAAESITVSVFDVVRRLLQWKQSPSKLLTKSSGCWRAKFSEFLTELGLDQFQFRPYSLRRGGATFWFAKHGSLDRLLIQGRWQAAKTARIYINSGLAAMAEMQLPLAKLRGYQNIYQKSLNSELPNLERTCKASRSGELGKKKRKVAKERSFLLKSVEGYRNPNEGARGFISFRLGGRG